MQNPFYWSTNNRLMGCDFRSNKKALVTRAFLDALKVKPVGVFYEARVAAAKWFTAAFESTKLSMIKASIPEQK